MPLEYCSIKMINLQSYLDTCTLECFFTYCFYGPYNFNINPNLSCYQVSFVHFYTVNMLELIFIQSTERRQEPFQPLYWAEIGSYLI